MGSTVYPIYTRLRQDNPKAGIAGFGLPYAFDRPGGRISPAAITRATDDLIRLIAGRVQMCPAEHLVLAGYSAGALIVGDAAQSPTVTPALDRLTAVVMLADPRFNPTDAPVAAGTFNPRYSGDLRPVRPPFTAALSPRTRDYCRAHDVVCQRGDPAANKDQHGEYVPQQTCEATRFVESAASLRRSAC
jgi:hypothetical protein